MATGDGGPQYVRYRVEQEKTFLPEIQRLLAEDLSEPYSLYVYRYFLGEWSDLCFLALKDDSTLIGIVICKLERHRGGPLRGYIAMLAVAAAQRGHGIASELVKRAIDAMIVQHADEVCSKTAAGSDIDA